MNSNPEAYLKADNEYKSSEQPQTTGTEDDSSNQNQGQQDSYGDLYDYFFGRGNSGRGN